MENQSDLASLAAEYNPLLNYAHFILGNNLVNLRPPAEAVFAGTEGVQGGSLPCLVLDRQGEFQTELIIVPSHITEIQMHTHPDVDSYELHVAGPFAFFCNGEASWNESDGSPLLTRSLAKVDSNYEHGGRFKAGSAFLSFQKWKNGVSPTTVGGNFEIPGTPLPEIPVTGD